MGERDLDRIFRLAASLEPDLVVLGGDLVEDLPEEARFYRRPLRRLEPPLGVFAVPGNHEYHGAGTFRAFETVLRDAGVRLLLNEGCAVERRGARLWVAGVEDEAGETADLTAALAGRREEDPVLLLAHRPDTFLEASERSVDLTLSGHTHGGQVLIGGFTPFRHSRYGWWRGAHSRNGCRLIVGRGIGVATLPVRIGAPPEIPLVRLGVPGSEVSDGS
jgi:predicted MPP superfamily phosphohydrolase